MSPINEMTPMAPQAHFSSEPAFGFISHTRLVTTSKAKRNTVHRGGGTFDLITGESLHTGGHDLDPIETGAIRRPGSELDVRNCRRS